jgi:uncharacterized delta-60 repeat protein
MTNLLLRSVGRRSLAVLLPLVGALSGAPLSAQADGATDTGFGVGGQLVLVESAQAGDGVFNTRISIAPNGSISLGFNFFDSSPVSDYFGVCQLSAAGGLIDCSSYDFGLGTQVTNNPYGIATQADGRRVVAGSTPVHADGDVIELAFLGLGTTDAPDPAFGGGDGKATHAATDFALARDVATRRTGEIVFAGYYDHEFDTPGTGEDCIVGRLHDDGSLDNGFDGNGLQDVGWDLGSAFNNDICDAVALYPDGRVVIAGHAQRPDNSDDFAIARLTNAGALDTNFSGNGKVLVAFDLGGGNNDQVARVKVDRMNRVVVAGTATTGTGKRAALVRLLPGGTLDPNFNGTGKRTFNFAGTDDIGEVRGLAILPPPANDIVVSGRYGDAGGSHIFVALLHDDGSFDTGFNGTGKLTVPVTGVATDIAGAALGIQGGKLVLAGDFAEGSPDEAKVWVTRLYRHDVFGDDFESGDLRLWSDHGDP